jgi:uncharacterized protein YggE
MKYLLLALILLCFASPKAQENKKYINITGTSEVMLPADQMNFAVQIKTISATVEASKKENDKSLNELLSILKDIGIQKNNIESSPITLGKNYEYKNSERNQRGYFTLLNVSFLLKDLSKYYELTNKLSSSSSFENISSNYSISDYELQNKLAYQKALKTAKEKAEYMASTLGLKLGNVLEIDENEEGRNYPNPFNSVTIINSPDNNISGKVTIKRSIRVKFALN